MGKDVMTQQELIWAKLALLAEIRQTYDSIGQSSVIADKWNAVFESLWSDLRNAKVEEPAHALSLNDAEKVTAIIKNYMDENIGIARRMHAHGAFGPVDTPGCCPEPLEGDSKR